MMKWVVRRDLAGALSSRSQLCLEHRPAIPNTGLITVEDCIASILQSGETIAGKGKLLEIRRGEQLVGHILISDHHP